VVCPADEVTLLVARAGKKVVTTAQRIQICDRLESFHCAAQCSRCLPKQAPPCLFTATAASRLATIFRDAVGDQREEHVCLRRKSLTTETCRAAGADLWDSLLDQLQGPCQIAHFELYSSEPHEGLYTIVEQSGTLGHRKTT
jgi:hypothetical protein